MDSAEAVRLVTLHFLETYKSHLDEDNYESAKLLLENTPKDKVVKKVTKLIKPFAEQSEKGELNKKNLIKNGWVNEDCNLKKDEIESMGKQAEMAYALCTAVLEMDPARLKEIETLAGTIQMGIEDKIAGMTEEEKVKLDPTQMITAALTGQEGFGDAGGVIGTLMQSLVPGSQDQTKDKKSLLEAFGNIDGEIKKKR